MPLDLPDNDEIINRAKLDVQRELAGADPFLRNSLVRGIVVGYANRVYDMYAWVRALVLSVLPGTATGDWLELWASWWGIYRLAATPATGYAVVTGDANDVLINSGTGLVASDGTEYTTMNSTRTMPTTHSVFSLTRSGSVATVTFTSSHRIASNVPVSISGADQAEYNVSDAEVTVTSSTTFTYAVSGAPATPATGTISAVYEKTARLTVSSVDYSAAANQDADAVLTLQSPIAQIDDEVYVYFDELSGGTDQETNDQLRTRWLSRLRNPVAHFNVAAIDAKAREVAGVTRVFVDEIDDEGTPTDGCVTIYFMRDNDVDTIPDAGEVAAVAAKIEELRPANTDPDDVNVLAPNSHPVAFTFSALSPDTATMRAAIEASIEQFAAEYPTPGLDIVQAAYDSAIFNTVDPSTGEHVVSYTLDSPSGTEVVAAGDIFTISAISWI